MTNPSESTSVQGDTPSEKLARRAFPILVRQARAGVPITYEDLAHELDHYAIAMGNALGVIGDGLENLGDEWDTDIPPIQSFVVSKSNHVPNEGLSIYTDHPEEYRNADTEKRRAIAEQLQHEAHEFGRWDEVLDHFSLSMLDPALPDLTDPEAPDSWPTQPSDESEAHRALKEQIAEDPTLVGLSSSHGPGKTEFEFRSGDTADVVFDRIWGEWTAVEVKTSRSDHRDLVRGLFQCVKYEALLKATAAAAHRKVDVQALLAVDASLPPDVVALAHTIGVPIETEIGPAAELQT